jgi:hypothetical protein
MNSRFLLTLLQPRQPHKPLKRLNAKRPRQQGFSLAVVLVSMLAVLVSSVALANRTQTGLVTASISGSNREAREVADAGIAYILSEWNRPANRGIFSGVQPMGAWRPSNTELTNNCNTDLTPTSSATTDLASGAPISLGNNRSFRLVETMFITDPDDLNNPAKAFTTSPNSNTPHNQSFKPDELSHVELLVEGTLQRGSTSTTAQARQRLQIRPNDCGDDGPRKGLFTYGGITPGTSPSLNRAPQNYTQGADGLIPEPAGEIECAPLLPGLSASTDCTADFIEARGQRIEVIKKNLSSTARAGRNPPTIESISTTLPNPGAITSSVTISGDFDNPNQPIALPNYCFELAMTVHCRVSSIDLSGGNLTINTTRRPVYLYLAGDMRLRGGAQVNHILRRSNEAPNTTPSNVLPDRYTRAAGLTLEDYQEDVFRFQIRGVPATASSSSQSISFGGTPNANLLIWAPAATLSLAGTANASLALYVNRFDTSGTAGINLVGVPGSFTDLDDNIKSFTASSVVFTQFF